jgi:hypothetical protein
MKWHYACPFCGVLRWVEWADRNKRYICNKDNSKSYVPPSPSEQPSAYVDTHNWPQEMEDAVANKKGNKCTVPDCGKSYETLDHRVAWANGGKTSVDNLYPMCNEHNQSKLDQDYQTWLKSLSQPAPIGRYLAGQMPNRFITL